MLENILTILVVYFTKLVLKYVSKYFEISLHNEINSKIILKNNFQNK